MLFFCILLVLRYLSCLGFWYYGNQLSIPNGGLFIQDLARFHYGKLFYKLAHEHGFWLLYLPAKSAKDIFPLDNVYFVILRGVWQSLLDEARSRYGWAYAANLQVH